MEIGNHKPCIPLWAFCLLLVAAFCAALGWATSDLSAFLAAMATLLSEGGLALLIFVAAEGFGWIILKRLLPSDAPAGLRVATACALGLWLLSTAVLTNWFWWPVMLLGAVLAAWQSWPALRKLKLPTRVPLSSLIWLAVAAAAGLWIAGATLPPELLYTPDGHDVLEYHLQLPREMLAAGCTAPLEHNVYSHYPLGTEMLFLLAMCLRGGAYQGVYAATLIHGLFAALSAMALWATLKQDEPIRARSSAALLLTIPLTMSLAWLAMVELAMVCIMTLAALWLRHWMQRGEWRTATVIGLLLGAGCATKYLSVGFLVAPVGAAMLVVVLLRRRWKRLGHLFLTAAATLLLFSPWLVRNVAATGNPVFPLATTVFGRGYWSAESQQRWIAGHGPQAKPPVPAPLSWQPPKDEAGRGELLWRNFATSLEIGPWLVAIAAAGLLATLRMRKRINAWDVTLALMLLVQLAVWVAFTHGMPTRFLAPVLPLLALLAGGTLSRLSDGPDTMLWRRVAAYFLLAALLVANLLGTCSTYRSVARFGALQGAPVMPIPVAIETQGQIDLPDDARFMLVGEARGWLWPERTIYATAFDAHPLAELAARGESGLQMLAALRDEGVTHIFINWAEIWRLARSYGYPAILSGELFDRRDQMLSPDLQVLSRLRAAGLHKVTDLPPYFVPQASWLPNTGPQWPQATLYALPAEPETQPVQP